MRKGIFTALLGVGVATSGMYMKKMYMKKAVTANLLTLLNAGVVGYGLAHIVLGSIDFVQDMDE